MKGTDFSQKRNDLWHRFVASLTIMTNPRCSHDLLRIPWALKTNLVSCAIYMQDMNRFHFLAIYEIETECFQLEIESFWNSKKLHLFFVACVFSSMKEYDTEKKAVLARLSGFPRLFPTVNSRSRGNHLAIFISAHICEEAPQILFTDLEKNKIRTTKAFKSPHLYLNDKLRSTRSYWTKYICIFLNLWKRRISSPASEIWNPVPLICIECRSPHQPFFA